MAHARRGVVVAVKPLSRRVRFATVLAAVGVLSLSLFAIATESSASSPRKKLAAPVPAPAVTPIPTPGIRPIDFSIPLEERIEKMRARLRELKAKRAQKECRPCRVVTQVASL